MDRFDEVLEKACKKENDSQWTLACDQSGQEEVNYMYDALHVYKFEVRPLFNFAYCSKKNKINRNEF